MVPFRRVIGAVLRGFRVGQGLKMTDVAAAARISHGYLSEVERGRKEMSSETLAQIIGALDVPPALVFRAVADWYEQAAGQ